MDRVVESQFGDLVVVAAALKQSIKRLDTELTNNIAAEAAEKAKAELEEKAAATQKTGPTDEEQETKEEQQEKEEEKEDSTSFLATEADWETAPGSTTSVPGLMAPMAHAHVMAAHAIMRQSRAALVELGREVAAVDRIRRGDSIFSAFFWLLGLGWYSLRSGSHKVVRCTNRVVAPPSGSGCMVRRLDVGGPYQVSKHLQEYAELYRSSFALVVQGSTFGPAACSA